MWATEIRQSRLSLVARDVRETSNGGHADDVGPLPDLDRVAWTRRQVPLIFDTNAATNASVQATGELAKRGAQLRVLDLQSEDVINGPDDFLDRYR